MDIPIRHDYRGELQPHTELLERYRDGGETRSGLHDGKRELPSGEKTGLFPVDRDQVRLGEYLQKVLGLKSLDDCAEVNVGTEEEQIENIVDRLIRLDRTTLSRALLNLLLPEAAELSSRTGADEVSRTRGNKVCAHLGESRAVDFREFYLEQNLLRTDGSKGQYIHNLG